MLWLPYAPSSTASASSLARSRTFLGYLRLLHVLLHRGDACRPRPGPRPPVVEDTPASGSACPPRPCRPGRRRSRSPRPTPPCVSPAASRHSLICRPTARITAAGVVLQARAVPFVAVVLSHAYHLCRTWYAAPYARTIAACHKMRERALVTAYRPYYSAPTPGQPLPVRSPTLSARRTVDHAGWGEQRDHLYTADPTPANITGLHGSALLHPARRAPRAATHGR